MIIGEGWDHWDFFLQLDVITTAERLGDDTPWIYGPFNFWIDNIPYPGNGVNITFNSTVWIIVRDYEDSLKYEYDGSNIPFEQINFDDEDNYHDDSIKHHLYECEFGELPDYGLRTKFEIVGDTLRFFYSQNDGAWQLKEIPLAYYESIIKKLDELCEENFKSLLDDRFNDN